ncbi:unnamed protein product, partial [Rangifer tarandus platyrhynchus]
QHQQLPDEQHSPPVKKTKTLQHEGRIAGTGMTEQRQLQERTDVTTGTATHLDFIREVQPSTSGGKRAGDEADSGGASVARLLPTWFQELLAAAAPNAVPPLVQHFCHHGLTQRMMRAAQHKNEEAETDRFEESKLQQPHKRRKLLVLHRGQAPVGAASSDIRAVVTPDGWERRKRGFKAEVAAVLQWSRACVLSLDDSAFCVRLCNAARLTVCIEMCDFIINTLWRCVARCRVYAAAVWGGAAAGWPAYVLRALLQQSRDVYICVLAAFEKCGLQEHLVLQEEKGGRGRRLQQQEQVLRRHVLQHLTNACHQQVRWWVDYWRFSRFFEEAAGMLHVQQGNCSFFLHSRPRPLAKAEVKKYSSASDSAGATPVVEKREEIERRAEKALATGLLRLLRSERALAAEVAAPCAPQQHYSGGCTSCGPNRLWCSYATAAHATGDSTAASSSPRGLLSEYDLCLITGVVVGPDGDALFGCSAAQKHVNTLSQQLQQRLEKRYAVPRSNTLARSASLYASADIRRPNNCRSVITLRCTSRVNRDARVRNERSYLCGYVRFRSWPVDKSMTHGIVSGRRLPACGRQVSLWGSVAIESGTSARQALVCSVL